MNQGESDVALAPDASFREARELWEREYVRGLLERCRGNVSLAARIAELDRAHLYRILRKHGLCRSRLQAPACDS